MASRIPLGYGIKRFGVRVAADVILARLHDVAGHGRPESLVERARKVSRRIESKAESERWRDSEAAVEAVLEEFASLRTILQEQSAAISEAAAEIRLECFAVESNVIGLRLGRTTTTFGWANSYSNTIRDAYLFVRELSLVERGAPNYFDRLWEPQREVHMGLWLTQRRCASMDRGRGARRILHHARAGGVAHQEVAKASADVISNRVLEKRAECDQSVNRGRSMRKPITGGVTPTHPKAKPSTQRRHSPIPPIRSIQSTRLAGSKPHGHISTSRGTRISIQRKKFVRSRSEFVERQILET